VADIRGELKNSADEIFFDVVPKEYKPVLQLQNRLFYFELKGE